MDVDLILVLRGRSLLASDRRVLETAAVQAAVAFRQQRLAEQASEAVLLAESDRMRRALLTAVSHDLRTRSPRRPPRWTASPDRSPGPPSSAPN